MGYGLQARGNSWYVVGLCLDANTHVRLEEYLRVRMQDPVLCLTVSATLRDKPMSTTPQRQELIELFKSSGGVYQVVKAKPNGSVPPKDETVEDDVLYSLEEVNLLEGLTDGMSLLAIIIRS